MIGTHTQYNANTHRFTFFNLVNHCCLQQCFDKYPVIVNKHAPQSQVEDPLTLTATSTVANAEVLECVTVFSFNIAVDLCLLWEYPLLLYMANWQSHSCASSDIYWCIVSSSQCLQRAYCKTGSESLLVGISVCVYVCVWCMFMRSCVNV